jgi:hypothetical protein
MNRGHAQISGEYRFLPHGATVPIWLREISVPLAGLDSPMWLSIYHQIGERERSQPRPDKYAGVGLDLMERCFHDIKNRLHLLSMELELADLESVDTFDTTKMTDALHAINDSLKVLQQHLLTPRR